MFRIASFLCSLVIMTQGANSSVVQDLDTKKDLSSKSEISWRCEGLFVFLCLAARRALQVLEGTVSFSSIMTISGLAVDVEMLE